MRTIEDQVRSVVRLCERSKHRKLQSQYAKKLSEQLGKIHTQMTTRVRIASICRDILKAEYVSQAYNYSFIRNKVLYSYPIWVVKILQSPDEEYMPADFCIEKLSEVLKCTENCMHENVFGTFERLERDVL